MILSFFFALTAASPKAAPLQFQNINGLKKIDASTKRSHVLLIDENCKACKKLTQKLQKSCLSFDQKFKVLATGSPENLKPKVALFVQKKVPVFTNPDIKSFLKLGASALPTYVNSNGKLFSGEHTSFKAILKDKVCLD